MKICVKCKKEFECGASTGSCWCQAIQLSAEELKILREKYEDCLCPSCLGGQDSAPKTVPVSDATSEID